jgi:hypothetical protein
MSKVIVFSRTFPKGHEREGEPTYFVEKIWHALRLERLEEGELINYIYMYSELLGKGKLLSDEYLKDLKDLFPKWHTIRQGNRFKKGDKFSPRVWTGKPYRSKQLIIAPDLEVKDVFHFVINPDASLIVGVKREGAELFTYHFHMGKATEVIADNNGLSLVDFASWFGDFKKPFVGQIICWTDKLNYG